MEKVESVTGKQKVGVIETDLGGMVDLVKAWLRDNKERFLGAENASSLETWVNTPSDHTDTSEATMELRKRLIMASTPANLSHVRVSKTDLGGLVLGIIREDLADMANAEAEKQKGTDTEA